MKTVKELENQLKISKVSLYSMLKKDEFKSHVFKGENNLTLVDDIGVELLKIRYLREKSETLSDIADEEINHSKDSSKADSKDVGELKNPEIIRFLQAQIEEKDDQIKHLLNIVLNQQRLHATQYLTDNQHIAGDINPLEAPPQPSQGFFRKIFRRKK